MIITPFHYIGLAAILFTIGLAGIMIRRNVLLILLSIELMLNAANLIFVTGAKIHGQIDGHLLAFMVMVIAAAEVTIGLAITVLLFKNQNSTDTNEIRWLKG